MALTAVALAVPLLGATPVTAATSFAATTAAARTPIGARTSAVQLPTGEVARVVTTPSGATSTQLASLVPGGAHSLAAVSFSGKRYLLPDTALPYLGGRLDRGLFDTAKLPAAGGRIPVRVSYTASTPPAVPGVTYTSTGTGMASGYLTNAGARQFGVALAKKFAADSAARSFTGTTLFGATAIRATTSSGTVTPALPMRTVIVTATDSSGAPMQVGGVAAIRTDAGAGYVAFAPIINGQARLSLPVGRVALISTLYELDATGEVAKLALTTTADYSVTTQNQTVRLNPGLATARLVAPATPRPAEVIGGALDVSAVAADGRNGLSYTMLVFGTTPLWVTPAPPATTGTLSSDQSWTSQNAAGGYGYVLAFDVGAVNNGIPADLTRSVASGDLATLNHRFVADVARPDAAYFPSPVTATGGPGGIGLPVPIPGTGTVYVNPLPGEAFLQGITQFTPGGPWYQIDDGLRTLAPASTSTVEWGRGPIVPAVPYDTGGWDVWGGWYCPACRTGTSMLVALAPATDTTPGHAVASFLDPTGAPVARFRVWENGTLVSDATDVAGALLTLDGSTTPKTYRILNEVNRVPSGAVQSTSTITDLTFTSAAGAGNALPAGWTCDLGDGCRVLPLLQAAVGLPVDALGRVPVGSSSIDLTLSHIQGAAATATSGATVEVRRAGGAWTTLPVTDLGGGRYRATLTTTSADSGRLIDLRVGGKDAAGGSITQTTVAAFAVA